MTSEPNEPSNVFTADDPRIAGKYATVYLNEERVDFVERAQVGEDGWVDVHPLLNPESASASGEVVAERRHGRVSIILESGKIYD